MRGFVSALLFVVALWPRPTATPEPPRVWTTLAVARPIEITTGELQTTGDVVIATATVTNRTNLTVDVRVTANAPVDAEWVIGDVFGPMPLRLGPGGRVKLTAEIAPVDVLSDWRVEWRATVEGVE